MILKKITPLVFIAFLFLAAPNKAFAQQRAASIDETELKEGFYQKYKKEVQAYDKKDFDALFLDFFKKTKDKTATLSMEEFYTYTIKIAIYSEKRGLLYKEQKEEAQKVKQEWFDKTYSDYLNSKK